MDANATVVLAGEAGDDSAEWHSLSDQNQLYMLRLCVSLGLYAIALCLLMVPALGWKLARISRHMLAHDYHHHEENKEKGPRMYETVRAASGLQKFHSYLYRRSSLMDAIDLANGNMTAEELASVQSLERHRALRQAILGKPLRRMLAWLLVFVGNVMLPFKDTKAKRAMMNIIDTITLAIFLLNLLRLLLAWVDLLGAYFMSSAARTKHKADDAIASVATSFTKNVLTGGFVIVMLENFNVKITAGIASFTVIAFAISIAAGDYFKNILGLYTIFSDNLFEIADHISVAGSEGFVEKIGIRCTVLSDFDEVRHHLPNAFFLTNKTLNFTKMNGIPVTLDWTVDINTDSQTVRELRDSIDNKLRLGEEYKTQGKNKWVDTNVSINIYGIAFSIKYFYFEGEKHIKQASGCWQVWHDSQKMKLEILLMVKEEMERRNVRFALGPSTTMFDSPSAAAKQLGACGVIYANTEEGMVAKAAAAAAAASAFA